VSLLLINSAKPKWTAGRPLACHTPPSDPIESPSPVAVRGVCRRRLAAELNHHELVMVTRRRPEPEARHSLPLRAWITAAVNVFWVCRVCVVRCFYMLDPEILVGSSGLGSRDDDLILLLVTDRPTDRTRRRRPGRAGKGPRR
jgi:hypothetical protein